MPEATLVLVLSRNERNLGLLADFVNGGDRETRLATSVEGFDALLRRREDVAAAVIDTEGFTENLLKRCERLDARDVPVLILAVSTSPRLRREAASRGVRAIFEKPVDKADLRATVMGLLQSDG